MSPARSPGPAPLGPAALIRSTVDASFLNRHREGALLDDVTWTPPDVFGPACLGPVELRNRVIKAATFEGMTPHGLVDRRADRVPPAARAGRYRHDHSGLLRSLAQGRTDRHQIWMRPEAMPGLRRLTDAVHAEGAAVSAQIGHAGPVANPVSNQLPALAPSRRLSLLGPPDDHGRLSR